ncbi:uncharacterized protein BT62DRAFT_1040600 [Guyanagaster necrorhizus]|uniref:F-box domain-containing protein n=1 Tax=Guyanagaster necrorhizus TaxID=856835 RepID=A0A9P7VJF3_9AGAR|nr:uncharacterized protein BT62DRAFT_1040600 [Guyanagaster necrorhizus MCA 3950]KAG7442246.1 hypothetical protein BT62DRAFT_1040600 [Guyanagaster necrorhizus MCA 3950]
MDKMNVAPINNALDDDILILIFSGVAAAEIKRPAVRAILKMSFVCRRWRYVALSFPELWTDIDVSLNSHRPLVWHKKFLELQQFNSSFYQKERQAARIGLLNLRLHRAGGYKLSVTVHGSDLEPYVSPCIDLISTRVERWRNLDVLSSSLPSRHVSWLIQGIPSFDGPESLRVADQYLKHFYRLRATEPTMPLLCTFHTRVNPLHAKFPSSLKMLPRLGVWSANVDTIICENYLCWFPLFRNALNLTITTTVKRRTEDTESMRGMLQMPGVHQVENITSLTLDINVDTHDIRWLGEHFCFPNLIHVKISYHKDGRYGPEGDAAQMIYMRYPFIAAFVENLLQFSPSLSSLILDKVPMRMSQVLELLGPLTSLIRLVIHEPLPCRYGTPIEPLFAPYYPISGRFIEVLSNDAYFVLPASPEIAGIRVAARSG